MASLIDNMDLIQGDSSTIFKFGESTGKVLDNSWEASFAIIETDPNAPIISRTLSKDVISSLDKDFQSSNISFAF